MNIKLDKQWAGRRLWRITVRQIRQMEKSSQQRQRTYAPVRAPSAKRATASLPQKDTGHPPTLRPKRN
jgi:hypothetical protein